MLSLFAFLILPASALAQYSMTVCVGGGLGSILCNIQRLLNATVPVLIALGVVYFVWGVVQYVIGGGEEAKTKGKNHMIWGLIGFAVIVGMWGLVTIVVRTFGVGAQSILIPTTISTTTSAAGGFACDLGNGPKLQNLFGYITCMINNSVIPLMFALAVAFFIWGIVQFVILGASEEAKRTQGRQHMIWGVIALAVMLGVWTLVGILGGSFGLNTSVLPQVRPSGGPYPAPTNYFNGE